MDPAEVAALVREVAGQTAGVTLVGGDRGGLTAVLEAAGFPVDSITAEGNSTAKPGNAVLFSASATDGCRKRLMPGSPKAKPPMAGMLPLMRRSRDASVWIMFPADAASARFLAVLATPFGMAEDHDAGQAAGGGRSVQVFRRRPGRDRSMAEALDFADGLRGNGDDRWHPAIQAGWEFGKSEPGAAASVGLLSFIDIFSGIGAMRRGIESHGLRCVGSADTNAASNAVYLVNYADMPLGDVTKIDADRFPPHDVIVAGLPCTTFSACGKQEGTAKPAGRLYEQVLKFVAHHQEKVALMECVPAIQNVDDDKGVNAFKALKSGLEGLGYEFFHAVLDAADFGVPQGRERMFMVAIRGDLGVKQGDFHFPKPSLPRPSVADIAEDGPHIRGHVIERDDYQEMVSEEDALAAMRGRPLGRIRLGGYGCGKVCYRVFSSKGLSTTLLAAGGGIGRGGSIYKFGETHRGLTRRERARIMGFPETHRICLSAKHASKQFGNALVPAIPRAILAEVIRALSKAGGIR